MARGNQLGMASAPPNQNRWPHRRLIGGTADNRADDGATTSPSRLLRTTSNGNLLGVLPPWRIDGVSHIIYKYSTTFLQKYQVLSIRGRSFFFPTLFFDAPSC
jgi:hypothetical protein